MSQGESTPLAKLSEVRQEVREELRMQLQELSDTIVERISEKLASHHVGGTASAARMENGSFPHISFDPEVQVVEQPRSPKKGLRKSLIAQAPGAAAATSNSRSTRDVQIQRVGDDDVPNGQSAVALEQQEALQENVKTEEADEDEYEEEDDEDEDEDVIRNRTCMEKVARVLKGEAFSYFIISLVVLNAIVIGVETDYMAQHGGSERMPGEDLVNNIFGTVFTVEVVAKMLSFGWRQFFIGKDWRWNNFDLLIIIMQWLDVLAHAQHPHAKGGGGMSFLRVLKMLRLARIMRLARVIQFVVELRTMISSISASLKPLCWASVLFGMLIYIVAIIMTQMVNEKRAQDPEAAVSRALDKYFDSLGTAIMSLWQCISGGMDWADMSTLTSKDVSPWMSVLFTVYIAFSMLAMMNVITGIFVDNASTYAQQDRDAYVVKHVVNLFKKAELNKDGDLSWDTFASKLATKELQEFFKAVDVDMSDARGLFNLVDSDGSGNVSPEELMQGWARLKGPAKALELSLLTREMVTANEVTAKMLREVCSALKWLCKRQSSQDENSQEKDQAVELKQSYRWQALPSNSGDILGEELTARRAFKRVSLKRRLQLFFMPGQRPHYRPTRHAGAGYEPLLNSGRQE
eukprot:TRINITY_DN36429_c0_g1_i1.p1 TRINITY_DN36429_c0_g1~~TRINITY_DN36429_c0_g1_i1.p1  ORF type:complete len:633 (+),score=160.07 TRINITY_DN36429_c0_g1_i1:136-2034(+)